MKPLLSVIMPCYNCHATLTEAFNSVVEQVSSELSLEIIMIDDASTDNTKELIHKLSRTQTFIKTFFHEKNRGGGAARNTGIREAQGEYIFCMDGDDILPQKTFLNLIRHIQKTGVDGAAFHERRFFHGANVKKYKQHFNKVLERPLTIHDLFNETNTVIANFLYTKKSFDLTGGYPEHHGFDTQCFETRFLASGCSISVCPESIYYHRQAQQKKSYYERVYESGRSSENYYLICEDIFHFFAPQIQREIIFYDIYNKASSLNNLKIHLNTLYQKETNNFFMTLPQTHTPYTLLAKEYFEICVSKNLQSFEERFFISLYKYMHENYNEAHFMFEQLRNESKTPVLDLNILRTEAALAGIAFVDHICVAHEKGILTLRRQRDVFERPSSLRKFIRIVKNKLKSLILFK